MNAESKKRLKKVIITAVVLVTAGILYGVFVSRTGFAIPCIFRLITGLYCPGCGSTRMCVCMIHGDIPGAYAANNMLFVLLPFIIFIIIWSLVSYVRNGSFTLPKSLKILTIIMIVLLIIYCVLRNIGLV
ncbi:MAG: DUF2752 domain-containing protein [Lachnospiraceae bacterium]|nr:DUF2752 domain-containing protein [Lachnospiraceae bacterium]